jgi:hypothetical protein
MPAKLKDPDARARRNKASTAADLLPPGSEDLRKLKTPPLTGPLLGIKGAVKPQVQRWWRTIWREPMAPRWLPSDIEVLYLCALLHQQIGVMAAEGKSVASLAAELRQQEARVGLDVLARRRLDWRIEGPRPTDPIEPPAEFTAPADVPADFDPRRTLRAL